MKDEVTTGGCLCGAVRFAVRLSGAAVTRCHCGKCRKSSGAGGIAVIETASEDFRWISGEDACQVFMLTPSWGRVFCRRCGCVTPYIDPDKGRAFIPAGLLDGDPPLKVSHHIFVNAKASWDAIGDSAPQFDGDVDIKFVT